MNTNLLLSTIVLSAFLTGCSDNDGSTSVSAKAKAELCEKEAVRVIFGRNIVQSKVICDSKEQANNIAKLEDVGGSKAFFDVYPSNQKIKFDMNGIHYKVDVALLDKDYKVVEVFTLNSDSGITTSDSKGVYVFKTRWGILQDTKVGDTFEVKDLIKYN